MATFRRTLASALAAAAAAQSPSGFLQAASSATCASCSSGCLWSNGLCSTDIDEAYCEQWTTNTWCPGSSGATTTPIVNPPPQTPTTVAPTTPPTTTLEATRAPTTTPAAPTTIAATTDTPGNPQGAGECFAVPDNSQAVTDEQCGVCATGYKWWPCNAEGLCYGGDCSPSSGATTASTTAAATTAAPTTASTTAPSGTTAPPATTVAPGTTAPIEEPGAGDDNVCSETGPVCTFEEGAGISSWFTKEVFDEMFPHICDSACKGCDMLTYPCLIKATLLYPEFANSGDVEADKREIAAWLGQMSQETTGGGCSQSIENPDGTCSCGINWCDSEPNGGCSRWGLCFVEEAGGSYCSPNEYYPCTPGKEYKGRGPKQLSYNYNYGQFSRDFCGDKTILLDNPEWVASNPTLAWASSIWFWHTGGACISEAGEVCKPGCHEVMLGTKKMCPADVQAGRKYGLGWVTNIVNGGLECGGAGRGKCDYRVHSRVRFYKRYAEILGVDPLAPGWTEDNLFCADQKNYASVPPADC